MPLCGGVECIRQMGQPVMQATTLKSRHATRSPFNSGVKYKRLVGNHSKSVPNSAEEPTRVGPLAYALNVRVPCENWRPDVWIRRPLHCDVTPCNLVELTGVSEKSVKFLQDYNGTGASSPRALGVRRTPNTNSSPIWVIKRMI